MTEDIFNLEYLSSSLKIAILNINVPFCTSKSATSLTNFSFSQSWVNTFPWWCATDIIPFLFTQIISSYLLIRCTTSSRSSIFSACPLSSFVSTMSLLTRELIRCFFYFLLVEPLHLLNVLKTFPQLKAKNSYYTINIKHPLQTKNATPLSTKHVLLHMIKSCKNFLSPTFSQNCFSDQPYQ